MATTPSFRQANERQSGWKIVRSRQATPRTPYDRPGVRNSEPENPNWFSKLVVSPSRMIASGAGKLLSSVFSPSSSEAESSSEDESDNEYNDVGNLYQATGKLHEMHKTSEAIKYSGRDSQTTENKRKIKHLIEQLLMQETFSREECHRLIDIINSRVVDCPSEDQKPVQEDEIMPDIACAAVIESRRWLEDKKLGSSEPKSDSRSCNLTSNVLPNTKQGETSSPVDVAKSYMQARPPWASSSVTRSGYTSPSPTGLKLFMEETLSFGRNSLSASKKKRDSLISGSWNIQEEIRRVRSKATEEMLKSLPSTKIDWSELACVSKSNQNYSEKLKADFGDSTQNSPKMVDSSVKVGAGGITGYVIQVLQKRQDRLQNDLSVNPKIPIPQQKQDTDASHNNEETGEKNFRCGSEETLSSGHRLQFSNAKPVAQGDAADASADGLKDGSGINKQHCSVTGGTVQELHNREVSAHTVLAETRDAMPANGLCSREASMSAHQDLQRSHQQHNENRDGISCDKADVNIEKCELLSEASVEVPFTNEQDTVANCSQNSSSGHQGEPSQSLSQQDSKVNSGANTSDLAGRPQRKKTRRCNTRGRSRGK